MRNFKMSKEEFDRLAEGLLFMSETDAPLDYYELSLEISQEWPPSTGGQFLQLIGEDPATHVEKLDPEKFFRNLRLGNEDREVQVAALRGFITGELQNLEGFRVGEIEIQIFVLGQDDSDKVVGLQTLSVET
jgi:Nuclease A inhibitor-like protein